MNNKKENSPAKTLVNPVKIPSGLHGVKEKNGKNSTPSLTISELVKLKKQEEGKEIVSEIKSKPEKRKPIIELINVQKSFKVGENMIPVLKDVNLKIFPLEFIIILGPSGSGKSTFLNVLLGLENPTSGKIVIDGEDITQKKPNEMAKFRYHHFGVVFQRADWLRSLSVWQNVALPLAINDVSKNERKEKALSRLKEMGMEGFARYVPTELSGGQQQKVCLCRALVNDPPILVADEPTGNLDSTSADKVMNLFKDLNEKLKKTLIMITHNIDYVRYASRTVYIRDGRIVAGML